MNKVFLILVCLLVTLFSLVGSPVLARHHDRSESHWEICWVCSGTGQCQTCGGTGTITDTYYDEDYGEWKELELPCNECYGSGICWQCSGSGTIEEYW